MSSRQRMRVGPPKMQVEWKVVAVSSADPKVFAAELQETLQSLTDGGYSLVSQLPRGDALVITGQRALLPELPPEPEPRRRVVVEPKTSPPAQVTEEVLYHYIDEKLPKTQAFSTLFGALRLFEAHLTSDRILPQQLTRVSLTRFDLPAMGALLRQHASDLHPSPQSE